MTARRILLTAAFFWCFFIVATPILASFGGKGALTASVFYEMFSRVCHQIDSRSYHIAGFKFGVCIRCTAIYASFFGGMLLFPLLKRTAIALHKPSSILIISLIPMGIDVGLAAVGIHESNGFTRMATGALFGCALSIILVPTLEEVTNQILLSSRTQYRALGFREAPSTQNLRNLASVENQPNLRNHNQIWISHATKT
ncbi:MAG: DUF2085 domain-containing protein [Bacteroidota bacterium]